MKSRRYALWQKVAALAPVALLLAYLPGQMMLRCRIDGTLREACCCPADQKNETPGPTASAQECCDREVTVNARAPFEAARSTEPEILSSDFAVTPFAPVALTAPPAVRIDRAWQNHGPPREGAALVVLKQAFLI
jgi:hypothetical protein